MPKQHLSRLLKFFSIALACLLLIANAAGQSVHTYATSPDGDRFLEPQRPTYFGNVATDVVPIEINVDDSIRYQQIREISVPPPCHMRGESSEDQTNNSEASDVSTQVTLQHEAEELLFNPSTEGAQSIALTYQSDEDNADRRSTHGPCHPMVAIDDRSFSSKSNLDYKVLMQAANFVDPGAYRIAADSASQRLLALAFRNPRGKIVLITLNTNNDAVPLNVYWAGRLFSYQQAAGSFVTFEWDPKVPLVALHASGKRLIMQSGKNAAISISALPEPLYADSPEMTLSCSGAPIRSTCEIIPDRVRFGTAEPTLAMLTVTTQKNKAGATTSIPAGNYVLKVTAKPEYGAPAQLSVPLTVQPD